MAADLQEPPELVVEFARRLEAGDCDVVVGQRDRPRRPAALARRLGRVLGLLPALRPARDPAGRRGRVRVHPRRARRDRPAGASATARSSGCSSGWVPARVGPLRAPGAPRGAVGLDVQEEARLPDGQRLQLLRPAHPVPARGPARSASRSASLLGAVVLTREAARATSRCPATPPRCSPSRSSARSTASASASSAATCGGPSRTPRAGRATSSRPSSASDRKPQDAGTADHG